MQLREEAVTRWVQTYEVPDSEIALMLLFAFRYALGRRSAAPSDVRDLFMRYGSVFPPYQRQQIVRDIRHAIETNSAGDDCDVDVWRQVEKEMSP